MSDDNMNKMSAILTILQISDTAFPTGGFSHSLGFESALKHGLVYDKATYRNFLDSALENTGSQSLPFVREAHAYYSSLQQLVKLDKTHEACLSNHVANRASVRQGCSLIDSASQTFPEYSAIQTIQEEIQSERILGHFPVMYGAVCGALGLDLHATLNMFMFSTIKTIVASSVRLGFMGTMEGQRIQNEVQRLIPGVINRNRDLPLDEIHIRFPVIDITQNVHDTMFSKLFYS